jgi:hypothetical protein
MAARGSDTAQGQVDDKPGDDRAENPGPQRAEQGIDGHIADAMPPGVNKESTKIHCGVPATSTKQLATKLGNPPPCVDIVLKSR